MPDPRDDLPPINERGPVDRATFEEIAAAGRPVVLRGQVADWPAVAAARRSDAALAELLLGSANGEPVELWIAPPELAGRFDFADDRSSRNHIVRRAPIAVLLDFVLRQAELERPEGVYAGAIPLARHLPGLRDECAMPLIDVTPDTLVSLWLGNRTRTAAHWDQPRNLACVVAGRRRFTLFPPDAVGDLYVGAVDVTLAGQPSSLVDVTDPDLARFPRFRDALTRAATAELGPGDVLYLPSLWWHHVEALDQVGAMVNFWWRAGPAGRPNPLDALYHALLSLRDLPQSEREGWRAFFDHYVFTDGEAAWAHLAEDRRGVFAPLTDDRIAALKAHLAASLRCD